jgi:hypothetical protein
MSIHIHIERLVLDGLPSVDTHALRTSIEAELAQLLHRSGLARTVHQSRALAKASGGSIRLGQKPQTAKLGADIAKAAYRGIGAHL